MADEHPGTWIRFWRSFRWLSRSRSLSTAQSIAEPPPIASPLVIQADDPSGEAAQAVVARASPPPVPVSAGPCSEMANLAKAAAQALAELSSFAPPPPVKAETASEALETVEVGASLQSLRPKTDFMLPARLAIVAKLNVASIRAPRHLPYRLSPGKAVPLVPSVQPARVRHPQRLEAMKPITRIIIQERPTPPVVIDLDAVRKALQSSPVAKHAA